MSSNNYWYLFLLLNIIVKAENELLTGTVPSEFAMLSNLRSFNDCKYFRFDDGNNVILYSMYQVSIRLPYVVSILSFMNVRSKSKFNIKKGKLL